MAFYGLEGEDYIWNENGQWEWTVATQTVADEIIPTHTISEGGTAPGYADTKFQTKYMDENTRNAVEALNTLKGFSVIPYPPVTLDPEDEQRIAEIQDGLSRYAEKAMACFVTGDTELTDENWDTFRRTVEELGLPEMISIWQKAIQ